MRKTTCRLLTALLYGSLCAYPIKFNGSLFTVDGMDNYDIGYVMEQ